MLCDCLYCVACSTFFHDKVCHTGGGEGEEGPQGSCQTGKVSCEEQNSTSRCVKKHTERVGNIFTLTDKCHDMGVRMYVCIIRTRLS